MSASTAPRRSARDRKQTQVYVDISSAKRKRHENDSDEDSDVEHDLDLEVSEQEQDKEDDELPDFMPRKPKVPTTKQSKPVAVRKPRAANGTVGRRKAKPIDTIAAVKDAAISDDSPLFNALLNPSIALESTAQDFLDSFEATPEVASAELVNCIFRLCGCNASVDSDQVMDSDGIVDFLGEVVEEIKGTEAQSYPLVSKAIVFRKLRKSTAEFFDRLVKASSETGVLYSSELVPILQSWIVAMSSAQLRSFRHTATVVALEIESALASVAAIIEKEAETVARQRETARKQRKGAGSNSEREKTLVAKASEVKDRKTKMNDLLKEFFDGVFIHRYRDADPGIRADCVREMGVWLKRHPVHFLEGNYLRYVGWVLSDTNTSVRLEAVKSLLSLYDKEDYIITLQHFTERFKPRLIKMATNDTELSVRIAVIQVLKAIDSSSLLEEEQRSTLCLLIFDAEVRVRKAISGFVRGIWDETVASRLVGRDDDEEDYVKKLAGAKALALLLLGWERASMGSDPAEHSTVVIEDLNDVRRDEVSTLGVSQKGRVSLAVEALWDEVSAVRDWETLLDILLLDHSGESGHTDTDADVPPPSGTRGKRGKTQATLRTSENLPSKTSGLGTVDETWHLGEAEETILVEVLVASIRKALADESTKKGGDVDSIQIDISRALIKVLPQLFAKHQTDPARMAEVLQLPQHMKLDLYLEMRMIKAYESLWDDINKQILTQTHPAVLSNALSSLSYMLQTTTLANTNIAKSIELDEELAGVLRAAVEGRDELDTVTLSTEEIESLSGTLLRLTKLSERRDMTAWMEENDGGKQTSAWEIVGAIMERGRLGWKIEEVLVNHAIMLLLLHVTWQASKLRSLPAVGETDDSIVLLRNRRDFLVEQLSGFVSGGQFNAANAVKRIAFQSLITLHILFARNTGEPKSRPSALSNLAIEMSDRLQHQCAGFMQAEAEAFAEELDERENVDNISDDGRDAIQGNSGSEGDAPDTPTAKKTNKRSKILATQPSASNSPALALASEYSFISVVSYFLRAIAPNALDARHCAVLLAYHGRLGTQFDHCLTAVMAVLREEGVYKKNGALVEQVVMDSLRQSFTMFAEGQTTTFGPTVSLAKAFSPVFVIRGAQLSISRRLPSQHVVEIHNTLLTWIIKRIAGYETTGNKKKKADAIEFFRVLHALLHIVDGRDASQIKVHMDKAFENARIEVPPTAKAWDAQRLYDKRLIGAMAKDKGIAAKGKSVIAKKTAADATDTEQSDGDVLGGPMPAKARRRSTRRSTRGAVVSDPEPDISENDRVEMRHTNGHADEDHGGYDDDVFGPNSISHKDKAVAASLGKNNTTLLTSATRPKPKPRFNRNATPPRDAISEEPRPEPEQGARPRTSSPPLTAPIAEPIAAIRKRPRPADEGDDEVPGSDGELQSASPSNRVTQYEKPMSQASQTSLADFTSSRKRARR